MPDDGFSGGDKLESYLNRAAARLPNEMSVKVGFLAGATYPDGTSVAAVAAIQEWGATINRTPSTVTVYRKVNATGTGFLRNGRFVKRRVSNFASTHAVGAYTITIPPRPFFRTMIAENSASWAPDLAVLLREKSYDAATALRIMGERISSQLQQSILNWSEPPNAKSTIARKGFNKPLIDTAVMYRSVDYEVSTNE